MRRLVVAPGIAIDTTGVVLTDRQEAGGHPCPPLIGRRASGAGVDSNREESQVSYEALAG
jgi:hypothetical protein